MMRTARAYPGTAAKQFFRALSVLFVSCAAMMGGTVLRAQSPSLDPESAGRSFIVAFPDTTTNLTDARFQNPLLDGLAFFIYSAVDNQVTIRGQRYNNTVYPKAGRFEQVFIQNGNTFTDSMFTTQSGVVTANTFRIDAQAPIVVYCYVMTKFGGEMWTPIAVERWGMEYFLAASPGEVVVDADQDQKLVYIFRNRMAHAQATIIAAYDGTNVTIYPTAQLHKSPQLRVTLNAGQVYQVQSLVDTATQGAGGVQPDIGGTYIVADRPIGVISGNTRAQALSDATAVTGNSLKNLAIEWLTPSEQFGRQFVYTPTWDTRRLTGARNEKVAEKRGYELVRLYGTSQTPSRVFFQKDTLKYDTTTLITSQARSYKTSATKARRILTEKPAQAMMQSSAVVRYNGTVSGIAGSSSYDTWAPYAVEMTPREQWTTFAPFFAPSYPFETLHYINVVADTSALDKVYDENGAPFDFNQGIIPGTDLMWGTIQYQPGTTHYLEAREGARFSAYAYGLRQGSELYSPKSTRASAEYREMQALSYGYPIAPNRRILRSGDTLMIDTTNAACETRVKVTAVNQQPVGLRTASLDSAVNASFTVVTPSGAGVIGATQAEFRLVPVDASRDASGVLVLVDRTGKRWRVPYQYTAERASFNAGILFDIGEVNVSETKDTVVFVTNPMPFPVTVRSVRLTRGDRAIAVSGQDPGPVTNPPSAQVLRPGDTLRVLVKGSPTAKDIVYRDTLDVTLSCYSMRLPLQMGSVAPCLVVDDLDFGELTLNQERTLNLRICNQGGGYVTLTRAEADSVISWIERNFTIAREEFDRIRNARLGAGQCIEVPVTFVAAVPGTYQAIARVWATTRDCRDTSVWRAVVTRPTLSVTAPGESTAPSIMQVQPNPTGGSTQITVRLRQPSHATVAIFDAVGRRVAVLLDRRAEPGNHTVTWDAASFPAGVYYCRASAGGHTAARTILVTR